MCVLGNPASPADDTYTRYTCMHSPNFGQISTKHLSPKSLASKETGERKCSHCAGKPVESSCWSSTTAVNEGNLSGICRLKHKIYHHVRLVAMCGYKSTSPVSPCMRPTSHIQHTNRRQNYEAYGERIPDIFSNSKRQQWKCVFEIALRERTHRFHQATVCTWWYYLMHGISVAACLSDKHCQRAQSLCNLQRTPCRVLRAYAWLFIVHFAIILDFQLHYLRRQARPVLCRRVSVLPKVTSVQHVECTYRIMFIMQQFLDFSILSNIPFNYGNVFVYRTLRNLCVGVCMWMTCKRLQKPYSAKTPHISTKLPRTIEVSMETVKCMAMREKPAADKLKLPEIE